MVIKKRLICIMDLLQRGGGGDFVDIFGGSHDKDCVVNS